MVARIWLILLCLGILSTLNGCYIAPYPYAYYAPRPYVYAYPRPMFMHIHLGIMSPIITPIEREVRRNTPLQTGVLVHACLSALHGGGV